MGASPIRLRRARGAIQIRSAAGRHQVFLSLRGLEVELGPAWDELGGATELASAVVGVLAEEWQDGEEAGRIAATEGRHAPIAPTSAEEV